MESTGLEYYSGDDGLNFAFLAHGASGVVSVVAHADAHSWREMITEVDAGDLDGARKVAQRIRPLVRAIMGGLPANESLRVDHLLSLHQKHRAGGQIPASQEIIH